MTRVAIMGWRRLYIDLLIFVQFAKEIRTFEIETYDRSETC